MWKYLFSSIPEIVFEAFAVCTLIWAVFSIFLLRKRNKVLFWLFAGTVFCMILWRISLHSVMLSSRYAAILIYPAAVFSGCLSMKSKLIFRWIFRKLKLDFLCLRLICRLLPVVVFTGLMIACTAKSLRVNSQGDFIRKICRKYLRISGGKGHVYVTAYEVSRISWHIKRRNKDICHLPIYRKESGFSEVRKKVTLLKNIPGDHYFFFYVRKGETEPNAASMNFDKTSGTWEVLARYYTSRRKNKEIILARYRSICPNIEEWNGKIPEEVKGNLYKAGNFETVLQGSPLKQLEKYYKENNVVTYTDLSRKKLPANWQLGIGEWNRNNPPDIRLLETAPLAGKYSLLLDSRTPDSVASCIMKSYIHGKVCEYTLFARGEGQKETLLSIMAVSMNQKEKKAKTTVIGRFLLSPGKVYRMRGIIPVNRYPEGFRNFCIQIYVKGSASLDQFTLIPVK